MFWSFMTLILLVKEKGVNHFKWQNIEQGPPGRMFTKGWKKDGEINLRHENTGRKAICTKLPQGIDFC